jgi:transposase
VAQKVYPARRWVVERTLAWLSKCRARVRYDKRMGTGVASTGLRSPVVSTLLYTERFEIATKSS